MEQVARWMHSLSPLSTGRFLMVNSWMAEPPGEHPLGPFPSNLLTQLEYAKRATLYVENVESLEPHIQAALSRLLQDASGSGQTGDPAWPTLELRMIATTQKDLKAEVVSGHVRPEFFHSISAFSAHMLPLRRRLDEVPDLVEHFVQLHATELGLSVDPISADGIRLLQQYGWPGNLREMEEMLISYVLNGSEPMLLEKVAALQRTTEARVEPLSQGGVTDPREAAASHDLDDEAILKALRENGWNRRQTANRLQISYRSLLYKLKKMDLASGHRRAPV